MFTGCRLIGGGGERVEQMKKQPQMKDGIGVEIKIFENGKNFGDQVEIDGVTS